MATIPTDSGVWVLLEHQGGEFQDVSLELMNEGRRIADSLGQELSAILTGSNISELANRISQYGADRIYLLDDPLLADYSGELHTQALSSLIRERGPGIVLLGATSFGRDLSARLAARLQTGLVSDCISLIPGDKGSLFLTKPTYGGRVHTTVVCPAARPQIATIRLGLTRIERPRTVRRADILAVKPQLANNHLCTSIVGFSKGDAKAVSLDKAEIIVAGGGGVGSAKGFHLLEELADALGGSVGGTRVAVDEGWIPFEKQIGQTGKTVAPKLYIACGISGSIYHNLGMRDSRTVVAINRDRNAPIFGIADVCIVGDLLEVVPRITRQLMKTMNSPMTQLVPGD